MPTLTKLIDGQDAAGTEYNDIDVDIKSARYSVYVLPEQLKTTHRILVKFITARYSIDKDMSISLVYKQDYDDTEQVLTYTMDKDNKFLKEKLPTGILCTEFYLKLNAESLTSFEVSEYGVLAIPVPIGDR